MNAGEVVRVAVSNNFNCTDAEWSQLDGFVAAHPDKLFFVNSNARTPLLPEILNHPYKAVITLNPDLNTDERLIDRALDVGRTGRVAFYRVKWLPAHADIEHLVDRAVEVAPVVITVQRFRGWEKVEQYCENRKYYHFEDGWLRLRPWALKGLRSFVYARRKAGKPLYICDNKGLGCGGCGLCATLNGAKGADIKSLNLSSSGLCPYSCPDCYAKRMQMRNGHEIRYDVIHKNRKQTGRTKHIQNARRKAA